MFGGGSSSSGGGASTAPPSRPANLTTQSRGIPEPSRTVNDVPPAGYVFEGYSRSGTPVWGDPFDLTSPSVGVISTGWAESGNGTSPNQTSNQTSNQTPATLSATACQIALGASSCVSRVTWTTPLNISLNNRSIRQGSVHFSNQASGNESRTVTFANRTFYIYNGSTLLDSTSAAVSCQSPGENVNGTCLLAPTVSINLGVGNTPLVRRGSEINLDWEANSTVPLNCLVTGVEAPNNNFTTTPSTDSGQLTSRSITHKTRFTLTCENSNSFPGQTFTDSVTVQVVPSVIEI